MTDLDEPEALGEPSLTRADRRRLVVDAFIDLALEDGGPPTPEGVAGRSGVSRATCFRYFSTLTELRNEAATRVMERFPELFTIPDIGTGTLEQRVERYVDAKVELHEFLHPLELLTRTRAGIDSETADFIDATRQFLADQARQHFGPELDSMSPAEREDMVSTIAVLASVESWQQFRRSYGRSPAQTRRAWRTALSALLAEAAPPG